MKNASKQPAVLVLSRGELVSELGWRELLEEVLEIPPLVLTQASARHRELAEPLVGPLPLLLGEIGLRAVLGGLLDVLREALLVLTLLAPLLLELTACLLGTRAYATFGPIAQGNVWNRSRRASTRTGTWYQCYRPSGKRRNSTVRWLGDAGGDGLVNGAMRV